MDSTGLYDQPHGRKQFLVLRPLRVCPLFAFFHVAAWFDKSALQCTLLPKRKHACQQFKRYRRTPQSGRTMPYATSMNSRISCSRDQRDAAQLSPSYASHEWSFWLLKLSLRRPQIELRCHLKLLKRYRIRPRYPRSRVPGCPREYCLATPRVRPSQDR